MSRKTVERGYGVAHRALRRRVAKTVEAGRAVCRRCRKPIAAGEAWHLGHSDDRRHYMGPEHAYCSLASGGRAAQRNGAPRGPYADDCTPPERFSRAW